MCVCVRVYVCTCVCMCVCARVCVRAHKFNNTFVLDHDIQNVFGLMLNLELRIQVRLTLALWSVKNNNILKSYCLRIHN